MVIISLNNHDLLSLVMQIMRVFCETRFEFDLLLTIVLCFKDICTKSIYKLCPYYLLLIKVKLSLYRPRQAPRAPGDWGFQGFQTIGTWRWQGCQPYAPAAFTPQGGSLVLISARGSVDHRAIVRPGGLSHWKISVSQSRIKPVIFRPSSRVLRPNALPRDDEGIW